MTTFQLSCILFSSAFAASSLCAQEGGVNIEDLFEDDFEDEKAADINDPLESLNRAIFNFNDGVYKHVARPFASGYSAIVPDPVEKGVGNVFKNLKFPSRFVGNLLQGKLRKAGQETGKFLVNTTVGLGGIFEASKDSKDLNPPEEDVGQALAVWGLGHGFYFVMPFLGPTSARDFVGDFADGAANPIPRPWSQVDDSGERIALRVIEAVNELPANMDLYDSMSRSSIDKYAAVRDAYAQRRAKKVSE